MEKISLKKYGFIRTPDQDFTDDGARFECYQLGKVRITKCLYEDEAYISFYGAIDDKVPWEVYTELPTYQKMDVLNGVKRADITEQDLKDLAVNCLQYEKEYEAAAAAIIYPTSEELLDKAAQLKKIERDELDNIEKLINQAGVKVFNLSNYDLCDLSGYLKHLRSNYNKAIKIDSYMNNVAGLNFMKRKHDNWYAEKIKSILAKVM